MIIVLTRGVNTLFVSPFDYVISPMSLDSFVEICLKRCRIIEDLIIDNGTITPQASEAEGENDDQGLQKMWNTH